MKFTPLHILIFLTAILFPSCNRNDGGDPELYGTWQLAEILCDGEKVPSYQGNYFWKFQSDVILIQEVDDTMHEYVDHFGIWSLTPDRKSLTLNFSHSDDNNPPSTGQYSPPVGIFITAPLATFEVTALKGNAMTLSYLSPSGATYTYHLLRR